jgi:hypothetical protein
MVLQSFSILKIKDIQINSHLKNKNTKNIKYNMVVCIAHTHITE